MSEAPNNNEIQDEAALDAELAKSFEQVKAGKTLEETPKGQTGELGATGGAEPTGATGATGGTPSTPQAPAENKDGQGRIPNKGKFESDEAYEKRVELFDLVARKKAATTPEAKAKLSEDIARAKGELKQANGTERFTQPKSVVEDPNKSPEDPALKADQERLRQLGGATKEDIVEMVRQERTAIETKSTLDKFVETKSELKDPDIREVFFDFVDDNYRWQDKTPKELAAILSMAYENMFKPAETIQERVLKGAEVAEKVNAMQFPGGTGGGQAYSPEKKQSLDELKAIGMSEEKARELLED